MFNHILLFFTNTFRSQVTWLITFILFRFMYHYITLLMLRYGTHKFTHTWVWHVTQVLYVYTQIDILRATPEHTYFLVSKFVMLQASFLQFSSTAENKPFPTHWTCSCSSRTLDLLFKRCLLRIQTAQTVDLFEDFHGFPHAFRSNIG